jgi:hypothetical protein
MEKLVGLASKEEPIVGLHVERVTKGDTQGDTQAAAKLLALVDIGSICIYRMEHENQNK